MIGTNIGIKVKVSIFVVGCVVAFSAILVGMSEVNFVRGLDVLTHESLRTARSAWDSLNEAEVRAVSIGMQAVLADKQLLAVWAEKDRNKLFELAKPLFIRLRDEYGITQFNFIDAEGLRLLVMTDPTDPKLIGTRADRFDVTEAVRTQRRVAGLALGKHGFALRVALPMRENGLAPGGRLIGYLEMGTEIGKFLGGLKSQTGGEYGMLLKKQNLKAANWADQRQHLGLKNNWDDHHDVVLAGNTTADESIFAFDDDLDKLPVTGTALDLVRRGNTAMTRAVFPISDASGARVGALFVLTNATRLYRSLALSRLRTVALAAGLCVVLCVAIVFMLHVWVFRRLGQITEVVTRVVGGDFETPVTISRPDEIGRFEELFEQLRTLLVGLLNDAEARSQPAAKTADRP
jgi:HAMP domain-containing protein